MVTNPIWVVKTRMFTSRADSPTSYTGLFDGLYRISKTEGLRGLWKGSTLALFGVSNGALQFMAYEKMKVWGFQRKRRQYERLGKTMTMNDDKLVSAKFKRKRKKDGNSDLSSVQCVVHRDVRVK